MAGYPFFVRPLPFTVAATGASLASNPATNLAEFQYVGMTWISTTAGDRYVYVDLGALYSVDFVAVLAANAQPGTQIAVSTADTQANLGAQFNTGALPFISPAVTTASGLYNSHAEFAVQTCRFVAIGITGHTGNFEAPFLVIGKKIQPSKYYEPEWDQGPVDLSTITIGRNGVPDIASGKLQPSIGFKFSWTTEAEFETMMRPLTQLVGKALPLYLCFDPDPSTYRQGRTYFGRFTDSLRTTKKGWNRFERQFGLQSMI